MYRYRRVDGFRKSFLLLVGIATCFLSGVATPGAVCDDLDNALKAISDYRYGGSREPLTVVEDMVRESLKSRAEQEAVAAKLAALLGTDATFDCKQFVCRQLWIAGTAAEVDALSRLLRDGETSDMARYALERMSYESAGRALRDALDATSGKVRMGIINSLGARGDGKAAESIVALLERGDDATKEMSAAALGKIGGKAAARALESAWAGGGEAVRWAALDAYLLYARRVLSAGNAKEAAAMFGKVYASSEDGRFRVAGFTGLVEASGKKAVSLVAEVLAGDDDAVWKSAAKFVRTLEGKGATKKFSSVLATLDRGKQAILLKALGARGDVGALPAVLKAAKNYDEGIRLEAIRALGSLGDASVVDLLGKVAAGEKGALRRAARESLDALGDPQVNETIRRSLGRAKPAMLVELIESLERRGAHEVLGELLAMSGQGKEEVRLAAIDAVGSLAEEEDMRAVIGLLNSAQGDRTRKRIEDSIVAASNRIEDLARRDDAVLAALDSTKRSRDRASLLKVLGDLGVDGSLDAIRAGLGSADKEVKEGALRALTAWPNNAAMDDLLEVVKTAGNSGHRVVAFRAYIRMLRMASKRATEESIDLYEGALGQAKDADERKLILAGLAEVPDRAALRLVTPLLDDEAIAAEAKLAASQIKKGTYGVTASSNGGNARRAIDENMRSRWDTGEGQRPGQWFQIDLVEEELVGRLVLDCRRSGSDYPRGYEVYVSNNTESWGEAVASGEGRSGVLEIAFPARRGRYIRIVQTGMAKNNFWSIHELQVLAE